jgi:hypothetical protein
LVWEPETVVAVCTALDPFLGLPDGAAIPLAVPNARKNDATPTKLITTYVVDKNKPLVSPAPE